MRNLVSLFHRDHDGLAYDRVEARLEGPMLALSILFVPIALGPLLSELSPEADRAFTIAGWTIWVAFVIEFAWLFFLAPRRVEMVRTHKLDLLIVALPLLRPLRVLRLVRLSTAASGLCRLHLNTQVHDDDWVPERRIGLR